MKTTTSPEVTGPVAIIGGKAHLTPAQVEELATRRFAMKTKHTPGKWIVDDRHIHPKTGLTYPRGQEPETDVILVVDTSCHANGILNETDKANLALAASAPDLLATLQDVDCWLIAPSLRQEAIDEMRKRVRAAIAQATGEK